MEYGELLTPIRIVNALLDLEARKTERIGSCFLEPVCSMGNFLIFLLKSNENRRRTPTAIFFPNGCKSSAA